MPPSTLQNAAYLLAWACCSVATSMYNKWVLGRLAFNFPMVLSCAHMVGASVALHAYLAWRRQGWTGGRWGAPDDARTRDPEKEAATAPPGAPSVARHPVAPAWWLRHHGRHILPLATLFAASVCLRNSAFAGLPLPVMQLLGSCAPLATYALSIAVGLAPLAWPGLACMAACVCGVGLAVSGRSTAPFSRLALARHATGIGLEVCRSVVLQLFIRKVVAEGGGGGAGAGPPPPPPPPPSSKKSPACLQVKAGCGLTTDAGHSTGGSRRNEGGPTPPPLPTVLLAAYAPVCAAMVAVPAVAFEASRALADCAGRPPWFWAALAGNVATALALNLAAVTCLHRVGVIALSLTGFAKDWGLVVLSTAVFGLEVSPRFWVGMLVTTAAGGVHGVLRRRS